MTAEAGTPATPDLVAGTVVTKAHGTQNDFVLVADDAGDMRIGPAAVRRLTDRRAGIGADGLIRVVRSAVAGIPEATVAAADGAEWFMDYRNADGSIAEMCGNGVRAFAHYLVRTGRVTDIATPIRVGTRGGTKTVTLVADPFGSPAPWYRVDMGRWGFPLPHPEGFDSTVETRGIPVARPALSVDMGNPHTVVALAGEDELGAAELTTVPRVDPVPGNGTNVEYIVVGADTAASRAGIDAGAGHVRMRVHERGVGETFACGTGACATAIAAQHWAGPTGPDTWYVEQPGGTVRIEIDGDRVALAGPAVLVGEITLDEDLTA
ncbi:diaminopimelate epimerase [Brevibacterium litoralis]|uniref:diaminopimelate epimerase n=1 Tax=Brevibacterium litoralis TaxID=3138935 RepID=UPI0032F025F0